MNKEIKITSEPIKNKNEWFETEGKLPIDLYRENNHLIIQTTIAGLKPKDLDICIEKDVVTIRGIRKNPADDSIKDYFHQECFWGPFSKKIILPAEVDPNKTKAIMKEGLLTISIQEAPKERVKKISVKKE